jgi:hypothetical protein
MIHKPAVELRARVAEGKQFAFEDRKDTSRGFGVLATGRRGAGALSLAGGAGQIRSGDVDDS